MSQEKPSKLKEIKETVYYGVEIIRQIRDPGVQESMRNVRDTSIAIKEIIESLKTPQMVQNIENFRLISENINEATTKIDNAINRLDATGIIGETKGLIKSVKSTTDSITENQDLHEISNNLKDTFKSVGTLIKVLKVITVS